MTDPSNRHLAPAIGGVGTAFPPHQVNQAQARQAVCALWDAYEIEYDAEWVEYFFGAVGVESRHLALPPQRYAEVRDFGTANNHYIEVATELGQRAIEAALVAADLPSDVLDAIFFTTVTGVASPSIDAKVINQMKLRRGIQRTPMFGLGCVGGAAGIARMAEYLRAHPDHAAVLLSVELCSLTVERNETSIADYIAAALFSDGAAAVVGMGADKTNAHGGGAVRLLANHSAFYHDTEWVMGWEIDEHGFGLVLSGDLPDVIETELAAEVDAFLDTHKLGRADIATWLSHPGGPKVLEAIASALALEDGALDSAWSSLAEVGNMSSASVLHVLQRALDAGDVELPAVLMAMGPGFSAEFVLLG